MLALHHEPENDIAFTCPGQTTKPGTMGSAAEYIAHVAQRPGPVRRPGRDQRRLGHELHELPGLRLHARRRVAGNDYVDYVSFNGYQTSDRDVSFVNRVGRFYDLLLANSTPEHDYASKEWGLVEWGLHNTTQASTYLYYQQAKKAIEDKVFPRLRFYMVFDNGDRNRNIFDFQVAYDGDGVLDPREQAEFNIFANSWALTGDGTPDQQPPTDDTTPPSTPTDVTGALTGGRPVVSWSAATDDVGVTGYDVLLATARSWTPPPASTYTDTAAAPGQTYSYTVRARDAAGNTGAESAAATVVVPAPDTTAPSIPTGVSAALSSGRPVVSWSASSDDVGVTGYTVLRNGTVVGTTAGLTYTDTTAAQGRTYSYTVRAGDAAGNSSAASTAASVVVPDTTAPGAPGSLRVARTTGTQAALTWTAATDNVAVTSYLVYRGSTLVGTVGAATRSFSVTGLAYGGHLHVLGEGAGRRPQPGSGEERPGLTPGRLAVSGGTGGSGRGPCPCRSGSG